MAKTKDRIRFTAARIKGFQCAAERDQSFMWDSESPGLGLRVTRNESRAFIYEGKLGGKTVRMTIGSPKTWSIDGAQTEARRLQSMVDRGLDPRAEKAASIAQAVAARETSRIEQARRELRAREAWDVYCEVGRTEGTGKKPWGDLHYRDHLAVASKGGKPAKRGTRITEPGPLAQLLDEPLTDLNPDRLQRWLIEENAKRPTRTGLAFRLLRAFMNWCGEHKEYGAAIDSKAHAQRSVRNKLAPAGVKTDRLQRSQLKDWFSAVRQHGGLISSTYLQCLLFLGPRPNELACLRWKDVDFRWRTIKLRDKVEGTRVAPLTDYVAQLLKVLPKSPNSPWVFPSEISTSGHISDPSDTHNRAVKAAGIPHLTLHGLRRSFSSLAEWIDTPKGVVAQVQGHAPSATAEKHYIHREVDLLRIWHNRIEQWILREAGLIQRGNLRRTVKSHST